MLAQCGGAGSSILDPNATNSVVGVNCGDLKQRAGGFAVRPRLDAAAYAQVVRLLPKPRIGVAPTDGNTLVNIDTILWAATGSDVDLGSATLLRVRVGLRAHLTQVDWSFGDGDTDQTEDPGKPYTDEDPCRTQRCPDYYSHVYERTGKFRVTATLTWAGQFRVGDGAWEDIPQTVDVDSPATPVHVKQARAVIVSNP